MSSDPERDAAEANAALYLRAVVAPDATVYAVVRQARDGRLVSLLVVDDGQIVDVSYQAALVLRCRYSERWRGIRAGGMGVDVGWELVHALAVRLYDDGRMLRYRSI